MHFQKQGKISFLKPGKLKPRLWVAGAAFGSIYLKYLILVEKSLRNILISVYSSDVPIVGIPIPMDLIPIPRIPKYLGIPNYWVKKPIPIPAHSHGNLGIPGEFQNPKNLKINFQT